MVCKYPVPCCEDSTSTCVAGVWQVTTGACMGTGSDPACPTTPPIAGQTCPQSCAGPLTCTYDQCDSTGVSIVATCYGTWNIAASPCAVADAGSSDGGGATDGGSSGDASGSDGGLGEGALCGSSAGGAACGPGLACCYPCGISGCDYKCTVACTDGSPGCYNGCMLVP